MAFLGGETGTHENRPSRWSYTLASLCAGKLTPLKWLCVVLSMALIVRGTLEKIILSGYRHSVDKASSGCVLTLGNRIVVSNQ